MSEVNNDNLSDVTEVTQLVDDSCIQYNKTFLHMIEDFSFGNLPKEEIIEIFTPLVI